MSRRRPPWRPFRAISLVALVAACRAGAIVDPERGRGDELWRMVDDGQANVRRESLGAVGAVLSAHVHRERSAP